ncbi:pyridoxal phosphate-dependent aminotransferase [Alloalcanivorax profundimaris]|uniref:pyridoxal phosphate-dependent aminotransferase n=1 Tax=Alloalcanivorax profundimaris TaxID=2735259 RepID=UPI000C57EFD0|nr:pyridoxal phosphate-dependent aminotransferase [Alloalcanivorax profundimaris]MAO60742.1 aspartate aminotransferase [Alcanivorax sp.]MCQ6262202.1 pyridoxal phosphate-dependent aminotransferase [Alcanivorax sp. MM125-6]UWN48476.1 Aspartate aminotransferase [Alcanivorax sp. ALC70]MBF1802615.1 pyridoxal phosphate-dependent aminotransferase [Alloalcanivorax profundimaris]MBI53618.1 aspartate aminotransferase [Alcanivorax sp.]|tara:strand:- start:12040 stop:13230 length:1191 start_codon:yes stop_codon:yes gene_type:complete
MSDINLSDRVQRIKPSPTLAITSKAAELRAEGKDIIGLGAGEPDFDTPDHIKQAAIDAINAGKTKYTPVDGTPGLKKAIIEKFKNENGLDYEPGQILVSSGGKQSFFNMALALLNDGDEAIIPAPYWVSYPDMVKVAGGVPVILESDVDSRFKITPEQLEAAITPKTRLFVINSPSNPSGMAYSEEELAALGEVLKKHPDIVVATDDMYEHILWTGKPFVNIVNACPELYDRTVVMNGVSKAYSMTGWRIGYAGGPQKLIAAMKKVQSQSTSNPASISQAAAEAALAGDQQCVKDMVKAFKERHDYVVDALNKLPGVTCAAGDGTFYAFPDFSGAIAAMDGVESCTDLAAKLLETAEVALVPGSAFGAPGCLRLSFATGMDTLKEAIRRIEQALNK